MVPGNCDSTSDVRDYGGAPALPIPEPAGKVDSVQLLSVTGVHDG